MNNEEIDQKVQKDAEKDAKKAKALVGVAATVAGGGVPGYMAYKKFADSQLGNKSFQKFGEANSKINNRALLKSRNMNNFAPMQNNEGEAKEQEESEPNELAPSVDRPNELGNPSSELEKNSDELESNEDKKKSKGKNKAGGLFNKNKDDKKGLSFKTKITIFGVLAAFIVLILMGFTMVYGKDFAMLDLTQALYKPTSKSSSGKSFNNTYTDEEIQNGLLYVGDFRTSDLERYVSGNGVRFISNSTADYNWLAAEGRSRVLSTISAEDAKIKFVVFNLGLYDLENADKYYNIYNSIAASSNKVHIIFMSVNPVKDKQTKIPGVTNSKITKFNNTIFSKMKEDYIDTYSSVKLTNSPDGVSFDEATYRSIHAMVLKYIKENYKKSLSFALDEYPHGTEGTELLHGNIITLIGQDNYDDIDGAVKDAVSEGRCMKETSAAVGISLAYGLYQLGYRLPYYWNGGHDMHQIEGIGQAYVDYLGVDKILGNNVESSCSDTTCYSYYGYDCTGFINWVVSTAMGKDVSCSLDGWESRSSRISLEEAEPGDIILTDGHAILVVENKGDYLQTLESTGGNNGLIFRTYNSGEISSIGGRVKSLSPFFESGC